MTIAPVNICASFNNYFDDRRGTLLSSEMEESHLIEKIDNKEGIDQLCVVFPFCHDRALFRGIAHLSSLFGSN